MVDNAPKIWNYFKAKGLSDYGIAGLMGNLYAESGLSPINLQNSFEIRLKYTDASYTAAVDNGSYTNFVYDKAGYGLAQWTYWSRKQALLDYARKMKKSIGDLDMQLDFLWQELNISYGAVVKVLKSATSVREASNVVLLQFEKPKKKDDIDVQNKRAEYSQLYYERFAQMQSDDNIDLAAFTSLFQEFRKELQNNDASLWSEDARQWATSKKIFVGSGITSTGELNYMWRDFVTREQMVTVLYRLINGLEVRNDKC